MVIKRGDMFYADLSPVIGSEQGGIRPVLVIQNDTGNKYSPTVIVSAITSQQNKSKLPTHIELSSQEYGLKADSSSVANVSASIANNLSSVNYGNEYVSYGCTTALSFGHYFSFL